MNVKILRGFVQKALLPGLLLFILISHVACSEAKGVVSNVRIEHDAVLDSQGQPDYAVAVSFTVENVGKDGVLMVSPTLSSSEGEWSRTQNLQFEAGESRDLKYLFSEPTLSAGNLEARVSVFP